MKINPALLIIVIVLGLAVPSHAADSLVFRVPLLKVCSHTDKPEDIERFEGVKVERLALRAYIFDKLEPLGRDHSWNFYKELIMPSTIAEWEILNAFRPGQAKIIVAKSSQPVGETGPEYMMFLIIIAPIKSAPDCYCVFIGTFDKVNPGPQW